ncbi:hypothetical protein F2P81_017410 [Scophthalmus maximus]|uniref:Uncharacterized protein n=1 Tax=Scophthalmus maximus TaxID=52904 RepID=A0A6A4SDN7_SCOMX|nr:hypothetical protein F2P81_017410 [Scophthalmus maximus]
MKDELFRDYSTYSVPVVQRLRHITFDLNVASPVPAGDPRRHTHLPSLLPRLLSVSSVTAVYIWLCRGLLQLNPHVVSPVSGPPDSLPLLTSLPTEPHLHLSS